MVGSTALRNRCWPHAISGRRELWVDNWTVIVLLQLAEIASDEAKRLRMHASELAFWPATTAKIYGGHASCSTPELPCLSKAGNGVTGTFDLWQNISRRNGYVPVFIPWFAI